jgi:hypothetical protein
MTDFTNSAGLGTVQADGFTSPTAAGAPGQAAGPALFPAGLTLPAAVAIPTGALSTVTDALTAHAGGGQANALLLPSRYNRVTTVASAADSVKLQPGVPGLVQTVRNDAVTNSMQVFGSGTDTINGVATGTGVAVAAGHEAQFVCYAAPAGVGAWHGPVAEV